MARDPHRDRILILDFGAQYTKLIARRVREHKVYCEIVPGTVDAATVARFRPAGVILSGGPASVYEAGAPQLDLGVLELGVPVLGICYGLQLMARGLGGVVEPADEREYGRAQIKLGREDALFADLPSGAQRSVWMSHGDRVLRLPAG